jgi:hypothetical protein
MAYINTNTLQYPISEQDIRNEYPNTSFPTPFVAPENYAPVLLSPQPQYNQITQIVQEQAPEETNNQWFQVWAVVDLDPQQIEYNEQQAKQNNKNNAESLLQQTDWTATVDISNPQYSNPYLMNQDAFLTYRSQVRAIAVNPPVTVTEWPVKPVEIWLTPTPVEPVVEEPQPV